MALLRLEEFDPNYRNQLGADIHQFDAYTSKQQRLGSVVDAWVDEMGIIQQLVIDLQLPTGQRRLMLPFGRSQMDQRAKRFYLDEASLGQVRKLMAQTVQSSRGAYSSSPYVTTVEASAALEASAPLEGIPIVSAPTPPPHVMRPQSHQVIPPPVQAPPAPPVQYAPPPQPIPASATNRPVASPPPVAPPPPVRSEAPTSYNAAEYDDDYDEVVEEDTIPLLEERLIVNRERQKTGEVVVRKEIETEIIEVPVQREKLIVEEVGPNPRQLAEIDLHDDTPPIPASETRQVKRSPKRRR